MSQIDNRKVASSTVEEPAAGEWRHKKAKSVSDPAARIRETDAQGAQPWCNFVVFMPASLPAGLAIVQQSLRPEAPPGRPEGLDRNGRFGYGLSNRASYRLTLQSPTARVHLKQFLYDLGPPAFDHPSFWLKRPFPFLAGNDIGWSGSDYRGLPSSSLDRDRTMIEVSLVEGDLPETALQEICLSLEPVSATARGRILATPYASLCYQRRYPDLIVTVPMGYWKHRRRPSTLVTTPFRADEAPAHLKPMRVKPTRTQAYEINSLLVFGDTASPTEVEWVFYHRRFRGHYLRILVWPDGSPNRMAFPPPLDEQPAESRVVRLGRRTVHHAFLEQRFGQHAAVWRENAFTYMLLTKPAPWTDTAWVEGLLSGLTVSAGD